MKFKITYYFEYKMDYGSKTKRYGTYLLDSNSISSIEEAKQEFLISFNKGKINLNPVLNITKGKIISKNLKIDTIIFQE